MMYASANVESKFACLEITCISGNTDLTSRRTLHHPAGSAAMGTVVESDLRVFRVQSLRVVDASVFPVPIAGHYYRAWGYALAEQAADIIHRANSTVRRHGSSWR